MAAGAGFVGNN